MSPAIEFWFDYTCPYAYLASTQVEAVAARAGQVLRWRPMLLGGVFRANGTPQNLFATIAPARAAHNARDMQRWAERFGVTLAIPPGHPLRSVEALRATIATGCDPKVIHGFYRAYWVEGRPLAETSVLREVLGRAGHDAEAILARLGDDELRQALRALTDEAIARGIFGAPAFVTAEGALHWGQDRLHFLEGRPRDRWMVPDDAPPRPARPHTLEVFFDFASPWSYLANTQVAALAARTGATVAWRPVLLGGLFRALAQPEAPLLSWSEAKRRYTLDDLVRWADYYGVPYRFPARFPLRSLQALRVYLALPESRQEAFREAAFRAAWAEDRDIADEATLRALLGEGATEVLAAAETPRVKQALRTATENAMAQGVFGVPTFVVDGSELFWGGDRLPLVAAALLA